MGRVRNVTKQLLNFTRPGMAVASAAAFGALLWACGPSPAALHLVTEIRLAPSGANGPAPILEHAIQFPAEQTVGNIWMRDQGSSGWWEFLCFAQGEVRAPAGKELWLTMSQPDLSPLAALDPGDLHTLSLYGVVIGERDLRYVRRLSALKALYLGKTTITDRGLGRLHRLRSLIELQVDLTKVSAIALNEFQNDIPQCKIIHDGSKPRPVSISSREPVS